MVNGEIQRGGGTMSWFGIIKARSKIGLEKYKYWKAAILEWESKQKVGAKLVFDEIFPVVKNNYRQLLIDELGWEKRRASQHISHLSKRTLTHPLMRIIGPKGWIKKESQKETWRREKQYGSAVHGGETFHTATSNVVPDIYTMVHYIKMEDK